MASARLRFHGELCELLPRSRRMPTIACPIVEGATAKHLIEALGVPHTEVGALAIAGRAATLATLLADGDTLDVHPVAHAAPTCADAEPPRFIADAHLGGLARRLRLIGFDTVFAGSAADAQLAAQADAEDRIVLSRDRELLKHRLVRVGRYVRAMRTDAQLAEVARRFDLKPLMRPFTRCLECNALLVTVAREDVADRLPPRVAQQQHAFSRCSGCGRIYWPGSHWRRLGAVIDAFVAQTGSDDLS